MTATPLESTQSEQSRTSKAGIRLRDMISDHIEYFTQYKFLSKTKQTLELY